MQQLDIEIKLQKNGNIQTVLLFLYWIFPAVIMKW